MLILALDTSSAGGSAAVARDGRVTAIRSGDPSHTHGEQLPRVLMSVLEAAGHALGDVDLFAVSIGPGSFTGLRVGIATMQGLAHANGKLVVPVTTFEALAWPARRLEQPIAAWVDAHRGEVFATLLSANHEQLAEPSSLAPSATLELWSPLLASLGSVRFSGDGAIRYRPVIEAALQDRALIEEEVPPLASAIAEIAASDPARAVRPHAVAPLYVRRPDAVLARERATRT
jgi:tRNA threonylcarbamoyladenosine biosynthesis protein TsaB